MTKTLRGTVRGRTIELADDLGMTDGQEVRVVVSTVPAAVGDGLRRCAGALADEPEWDRVMAEVYRERKRERRSMPEAE